MRSLLPTKTNHAFKEHLRLVFKTLKLIGRDLSGSRDVGVRTSIALELKSKKVNR